MDETASSNGQTDPYYIPPGAEPMGEGWVILQSSCLIWEITCGRRRSPGYEEFRSKLAGGEYRVREADKSKVEIPADNISLKLNLSRWIYEQNLHGASPVIDTEIIRHWASRLLPSALERVDNLLNFIDLKTRDHLGHPIGASDDMLAATPAESENELSHILEIAKQQGFIDFQAIRTSGANMQILGITFKPEGYRRLEELQKGGRESSQVFVAMWFDSSMDDAYENGIKKGIEDAGYKPLRIDRKKHNNKIDDEIIAEIRRSRFLVADFTFKPKDPDAGKLYEPRGGVYYEAGFAYGLNIPVIYTCRKDMMRNVHFDTRQFNHITWKTPEDLRKQLKNRISAAIGDGPLTPPHRD